MLNRDRLLRTVARSADAALGAVFLGAWMHLFEGWFQAVLFGVLGGIAVVALAAHEGRLTPVEAILVRRGWLLRPAASSKRL